MVSALLLKLNGWPETFDERAQAITATVDNLTIIRPKSTEETANLREMEQVTLYNLYPARGSFVKPSLLKPIVFPLHVIQAIILMIYLHFRGKLPPVIHAFDYALGGLAGTVISRLFDIPFVVSVRGLKEPRYETLLQEEQTVRAWLSYRILLLITGFVIRSADHIITKATYQVEFVRKTFEVDPEFTTVPTGVDFEVFDPDQQFTISEMDLPAGLKKLFDKNEHIILYLAKLTPAKGGDKILEFIAAAGDKIPSDITFVFIGEFQGPSFEHRFRKLQQGVAKQTVLYPDRVPFSAVPSLLSQADAVTLLSQPQIEGVPRILQESCAMQAPIIASNVVGIGDEFDGLPGCFLIDRNDTDAFVKAVNKIHDDPPEMPREKFAGRFDLYRNYAKYGDIYRNITAQSGSQAANTF